MKLYKHQKDFLDKDPSKAMLCWDTGLGKSFISIKWLKIKGGSNLIICPKVIKQDWIDNLKENNLKGTVFTKEEIKKLENNLNGFNNLIVDEALYFASPLWIPKLRSQMSEVLYTAIKNNPKMNVLLATATPLSSSPYNGHSLLTYIGRFIDFKTFRDTYFSLESPRYLKGRMTWLPKEDWRKNIRNLLFKQDNIFIASVSDIIDDVPEEKHLVVDVKLAKETKETIDKVKENPDNESDMKIFIEEHKLETGKEKIKEIKNIAKGFKQVLLVAKYKDTIKMLEKELSKEREVFVITGEVKDQSEVIKKANESFECYVIVQSQISSGFELPLFPTTIFVQEGYKYSDFVQMKGRNRRINHLHRNYYYYLVAGKRDKQVRKTLEAGEDLDFKNIE